MTGSSSQGSASTTGSTCFFYNAGWTLRAGAVTGCHGHRAYIHDRIGVGPDMFSTSCAATSRTNTNGAPSTSPSSASWSVGHRHERTSRGRSVPASSPGAAAAAGRRAGTHRPAGRDGHQWRCPGARLDAARAHRPDPLRRPVISLCDGSRSALACLGRRSRSSRTTSTNSGDLLARVLDRVAGPVVHGHMYRAEVVGVRAAERSRNAACPARSCQHRPFVARPQRRGSGAAGA